MAKRGSKAVKTVDGAQGTVTFKFANGSELVARPGEFSDEIRTRLMLHGASQKIGDSYADDESVAEAYLSAKEVIAALERGVWSERTPGEPRIGLLVEGLLRVRQKSHPDATMEQCQAVVESMDAEKKKALRANPQIKAAMAEIQAERARAEAEKSAESVDNLF